MQDPAEEHAATAERISWLARSLGLRVATAESLTCGSIAVALGAAPEASVWFRGGVVAYDELVKRDLLDVAAREVLSTDCAREMARGAAKALWADAVVAVTGVGGPDPVDGFPPGTVFLAAVVGHRVIDDRWCFDEEPAEVVHSTVGVALRLLEKAMESGSE